MKIRFSAPYIAGSTALSLILAGPVSADVTSAQVWNDLKSYMSGVGYEVSGTESASGGTLTVTDINMSMQLPEVEGQTGTAGFSMDQLVFSENGDGTVNVELPGTMPMTFSANLDGEAVSSGVMNVTQVGATMVVSGDPGDITYDYKADSMTVSLDDFDVEGADMPAEAMNVSATMRDVASVTTMKVGDMRDVAQSLSASAMDYSFAVDVPEGPDAGKVSFVGSMAGLSALSTGKIPTQGVGIDFSKMIAAGFEGAGTFKFESGNSTMNADTPDGKMAGTTSSKGGTLGFGLTPAGLTYEASLNDLATEMQVPNLPFPVALTMAKSGFNLKMPVQAGDQEQDFAFGFTMSDFTISDMIWGLFDPAGQLPRDPATLALDLTGKMKMLVNIFEPEGAAALESGAAPGEVNAVNINNLEVSAAGASLTGSGAVTLDNTDMSTIPGMPKPTGDIDVRVEGANALIDTLVNMGLLPQDQAMGARMMMGLFGVPQGDDVLTSKIEFTEEGHILANGQRLQ